ncbi:MAG: hypothetical protein HY735_06605 [Verrucomicrobia bacterium]|nr:hypothetical protein [Verrucomicrobiota bacterium]
MSDEEMVDNPFPVLTADGCLECDGSVCQPWPSLEVNPQRALCFEEPVLRASAGSRLWPFVERIPERVRKLVSAMPSYRWAFLELCAEGTDRGVELLELCPALAMCLVHEYCPTRHGDRQTFYRAMLALRWRELLRVLNLPARPRTIRLLRKLGPEHCPTPLVARFCRVLRAGHPWLHVLPHLTHITRDTIGLLRLDPALVTPALLRASATSQPDEEPVTWLVTTVKVLRAESGSEGQWSYAGCDLNGLKSIERKLRADLLASDAEPFPPPPFEGTPGAIVPLMRFADLAEKGEDQQHCATTYLGEIMAGRTYFYQVLRPERATLAVRKSTNTGAWVVHDLHGAGNAAVGAKTGAFVSAWLRQQGDFQRTKN